MASGEQLKALLKSHVDGDDDRFFSVAMQVAAHEARRGHGRLAEELRALIDRAKTRFASGAPVPIGRPRGELANLLEASYPSARLGEMILGKDLGGQIQRVIREQRHAGRIVERGLAPRRKLLLTGPPGTGKTLTASVLAGELGVPLLQVRLDGLITKYMGETAAKLRQIFEATGRTRGVYFFDEFDAIGSRARAHERRGRDPPCAQQLSADDRAGSLSQPRHRGDEPSRSARSGTLPSFRRHPALRVARPAADHAASQDAAVSSAVKRVRWNTLADLALGLSYAEVARAANEVLKDALIHERLLVREADIRVMLQERQTIAAKLSAAKA